MSSHIRILDSHLINQIAAGEVIERPFAVVKELIENSIDAKASRIQVITRDGGKALIEVIDDGAGMNSEDLPLCLERHATSKLEGKNLFSIKTFGFRGEALPSIASVARIIIQSKTKDCPSGWQIESSAGQTSEVKPCSWQKGTRVEVRDLFFATPARLKFLKNATPESQAIKQVIERTAMQNPNVRFTYTHNDKTVFDYVPADFKGRIQNILGADFTENSILVDGSRDGIKLGGLISLPTFHASQQTKQYFFVNGRFIKDKMLSSMLRVAYSDLLAHQRFAVCVLNLEVPAEDVDVNVHPAKTEIRFCDTQKVRSAVLGILKHHLNDNAQRVSDHRVMNQVAQIASGSEGLSPVRDSVPFSHAAPAMQQSIKPALSSNFIPRRKTTGLAPWM